MKTNIYKYRIWIIIFLVFAIVILNFFQKEIRGFIYSFSEPVQKFFWVKGQGISNSLGGILNVGSAAKKISDLETENQKLLSEITLLNSLRDENETLRKALDFRLKDNFKFAFAEIISKDIEEDSITINKGTADGLAEGMPVITESNVLLGKISEVYKRSSKVMLISNKKSSLEAKIQNKEIQGVLEGEGNLSMSLRILPQEKEITGGDLAITTSLGGIFPENLLIGKVEKLERNDIKPVQTATILPLFEIGRLSNIFVILNF